LKFGLQRTSGYGFLKILRVEEFFSFRVFKNYKTNQWFSGNNQKRNCTFIKRLFE
jgi:hypothetical protein